MIEELRKAIVEQIKKNERLVDLAKTIRSESRDDAEFPAVEITPFEEALGDKIELIECDLFSFSVLCWTEGLEREPNSELVAATLQALSGVSDGAIKVDGYSSLTPTEHHITTKKIHTGKAFFVCARIYYLLPMIKD